MLILLTHALVVTVALIHVWILVLEMFLWSKPIGLRAFGMKPAQAEATRVLAANQGLYNGFLAAGLLCSFAFANSQVAYAFQVFFLGCVVMAGLFGARTVSFRIFYIQSLPALAALAGVLGTKVQ